MRHTTTNATHLPSMFLLLALLALLDPSAFGLSDLSRHYHSPLSASLLSAAGLEATRHSDSDGDGEGEARREQRQQQRHEEEDVTALYQETLATAKARARAEDATAAATTEATAEASSGDRSEAAAGAGAGAASAATSNKDTFSQTDKNAKPKTTKSSTLAGCQGNDCVKAYLKRSDDVYRWEKTGEMFGVLDGVAWKAHKLNLTSQRWLTEDDVSPSIWTHPLVVIVPSNFGRDLGRAEDDYISLVVGGALADSRNPVNSTDGDVQAAIYLAVHTRSIAAALLQVPNQPLVIQSDPTKKLRTEDQIKAKTYRHFIDDPSNAEWLLELPNAKAVVRSMNAVEAFVPSLGFKAKRFGLMGCSKRANAVMMACANDPRCELLIPCCMTGNTSALYLDSLKDLGLPMVAAVDYNEEHVFATFTTPGAKALYKIVDSSSYAQKLTAPKLWLSATADDFFPPDHTKLFWSKMPAPKYLFQKPNAPHIGTLSQKDFLPPAAAFVSYHLHGVPWPELDWVIHPRTGATEVKLLKTKAPLPTRIQLWTATTCSGSKRKDFRQHTLYDLQECSACGTFSQAGCAMTSNTWSLHSELDPSLGDWIVSLPDPDVGFLAYFLTFDFPPATSAASALSAAASLGVVDTAKRIMNEATEGPEAATSEGGLPLQLSTEVVVLPFNSAPFPGCDGTTNCDSPRMVF